MPMSGAVLRAASPSEGSRLESHHGVAAAFHERRQAVLQRRQAHFVELMQHRMTALTKHHPDAAPLAHQQRTAAVEEEARPSVADEEVIRRPVPAWGSVLLLTLHFLTSFQKPVVEKRAAATLRKYLAPLCLLRAHRMRKRQRQQAFQSGDAAPMDRPDPSTLKLSSPMLAKWPDAVLELLSRRMSRGIYFAGEALFVRGELSRTSDVHLLCQDTVVQVVGPPGEEDELVPSPDPTGAHRSRRQLSIASGSLLGEFATFVGDAHRATYTCLQDCVVFSVSACGFMEAVQALPSDIFGAVSALVKQQFKRRMQGRKPAVGALQHSHVFFELWTTEALLDLLELGIGPSVFSIQERIFRDAATTPQLYFIVSGRVVIEHRRGGQKESVTLAAGSALGTESVAPLHHSDLVGEHSATAMSFVEAWSFARDDVIRILARFNIRERVSSEFQRAVACRLSPIVPSALATANSVFAFLPEKTKAALAASCQPFSLVLPDDILVRQGSLVTHMIVVMWGNLQLTASNARTREKTLMGELHAGDIFGAAEVVSQAISNVNVVASSAAVVGRVARQTVYDAILVGGSHVLSSVIERANQLVGARSAEAQRLQEELRMAREAAERLDNDPDRKISDARALCIERVRRFRQTQKDIMSQLQTAEARERKLVAEKLAAETRRARQLQRLTIEHRVFSSVKNQIYGGTVNEYAETLKTYFASPFDADEPCFTAAAVEPPYTSEYHPTTGFVATVAPANDSDVRITPVPVTMLSQRRSKVGGDASSWGSKRLPEDGLVMVGTPHPPGGRHHFEVSDPLPYLALPSTKIPRTKEPSQANGARRTAQAEGHATERLKERHLESDALLLRLICAPPPRAAEFMSAARTEPEMPSAAPPLSLQSPAAKPADASMPSRRQATKTTRENAVSTTLPPVYPDMRITVDPSKFGRSVGAYTARLPKTVKAIREAGSGRGVSPRTSRRVSD